MYSYYCFYSKKGINWAAYAENFTNLSKTMKLTGNLHFILIGLMLGDGSRATHPPF